MQADYLYNYGILHSQMIILYKHPAGEINVVSEKSVIRQGQAPADSSELTTLRKRIQVLESTLTRREVMKVDYT